MSRFNGNYVTKETHAKTDAFRYQFMNKIWKMSNPMDHKAIQQIRRIPGWICVGAMDRGERKTPLDHLSRMYPRLFPHVKGHLGIIGWVDSVKFVIPGLVPWGPAPTCRDCRRRSPQPQVRLSRAVV